MRIGYSENCSQLKQRLNKGYDSFYTNSVADSTIEHEVIKNYKLINNTNNFDAVNIKLELDRYETIDAINKSNTIMSELNIQSKFISIGVGSSLLFKTLTYEKWGNIAASLNKKFKRDIIIFGGKNDTEIAEKLAANMHCTSVTGRLLPHEVYSLIKHSSLAICADSFVKHVAASAGVPTIEISSHSAGGDSKSEFGGIRFGAWGNNSAIIKPRSHRQGCLPDRCLKNEPHCILDIDIEEIMSCAERLILKHL